MKLNIPWRITHFVPWIQGGAIHLGNWLLEEVAPASLVWDILSPPLPWRSAAENTHDTHVHTPYLLTWSHCCTHTLHLAFSCRIGNIRVDLRVCVVQCKPLLTEVGKCQIEHVYCTFRFFGRILQFLITRQDTPFNPVQMSVECHARRWHGSTKTVGMMGYTRNPQRQESSD